MDQIAGLALGCRVDVFAPVVACTKRLARPGPDHGEAVGIGMGIVHCAGQIVDQRAVHGIQAARTVERDDPHCHTRSLSTVS